MNDRLIAQSRAVDPDLDLLAVAAACDSRSFFLEAPSRQEAWLGIGAARIVVTAGTDRFTEADREIRRQSDGVEGDAQDLRWLGGFAFSDTASTAPEWRELPPLLFVVPELLWRKRAGECRLTTFATMANGAGLGALAERWMSADAGTRPLPSVAHANVTREDAERFVDRVSAAQRSIAAGELAKVVLSMRRELVGCAEPDAWAIVAAARAARPECATFLVRGERTSFLGSSPELLVRRRGADVDAMAIAGSAPRGETAERDATLGAGLLACAKNGGEHSLVVDAVENALRPLARRLRAAPSPALLRLPEAQHLRTTVTAELTDPPAALLELARRLHPTPAVCGVPREVARRRLEAEEADRGWYAGAVGWTDARGDGELFVALRSMVLDGSRAIIRAGAGIVAASDPSSELAEVEAKLGALLGAPSTARHAAA